MIKSLALSAAVIFALAAPALAMDGAVHCTATEKNAIMKMIHASKDEAMMKMAMHNVEMAQKMASAGDFKGCREDLMKAMKEVTPK